MSLLDDRLLALREHARGWATDLRSAAMAVDADATAVEHYLDRPALRYLATARYSKDGEPIETGGHAFHLDTALERVVFLEELGYGDVGVLLAAPGAPMAGVLVQLLGDQEQQDWLFGRLHERPTWAFFALTEPDGGSDAANLRTRIEGSRLTGTKRYVGNAPRGGIGVVFARTGPGPLGARAVLVDAADPGFSAEALPTIGLRGAMLGEITLDGVDVPPQRLLGRHLPATRRGMWGWVRTFNLLRPSVAAFGIAIAAAAHDYVRAHRTHLRCREQATLDDLGRRIAAARALNHEAAAAVDVDPADGHLASAAKVRAARLAEDVTLAALDYFGPGARFEHPLLAKLARDARGVEFMEGAGHVQRLLVAHHLIGRQHREANRS